MRLVRLQVEFQTLLRAHGHKMHAYALEAPSQHENFELREPVLHDPNPLIEYEMSLGGTKAQRGSLLRPPRKFILRVSRFTAEQRYVYSRIPSAVKLQTGGFFILNAAGGIVIICRYLNHHVKNSQ